MTAADRCVGLVRGTAGEGEHGRAWRRWHHLGGRVRPVLGDACLVGRGRWPAAAVRWDLNPASCCLAVRGRSGVGRVTCGSCAPVVAVGARRRPGVFRCRADPARTRPQIPADSRPVADASGALIREWPRRCKGRASCCGIRGRLRWSGRMRPGCPIAWATVCVAYGGHGALWLRSDAAPRRHTGRARACR